MTAPPRSSRGPIACQVAVRFALATYGRVGIPFPLLFGNSPGAFPAGLVSRRDRPARCLAPRSAQLLLQRDSCGLAAHKRFAALNPTPGDVPALSIDIAKPCPAIDALGKGDVLVVAEWDRATRSMIDGVHIIERIHAYSIRRIGANLHAIVELSDDLMPPDHPRPLLVSSTDPIRRLRGGINALTAPQPSGEQAKIRKSAPRGDVNIDVMIAYTKKAASYYGDIQRELIDLSMEAANQSFRISNLGNVKLRLVHAYETTSGMVAAILLAAAEGWKQKAPLTSDERGQGPKVWRSSPLGGTGRDNDNWSDGIGARGRRSYPRYPKLLYPLFAAALSSCSAS
jgi:hypothetical protein